MSGFDHEWFQRGLLRRLRLSGGCVGLRHRRRLVNRQQGRPGILQSRGNDNSEARHSLRTCRISAKERWFATARGRLGYAVDKWLFYVTGGAAWMKIDSEYTASAAGGVSVPNAAASQSDRRTGWTVGAGLDYALSYGWSIRSEYLYIAIPSYTTFTDPTSAAPLGLRFPTLLETRLYNHVLALRSYLQVRVRSRVVAAVTK